MRIRCVCVGTLLLLRCSGCTSECVTMVTPPTHISIQNINGCIHFLWTKDGRYLHLPDVVMYEVNKLLQLLHINDVIMYP